MTLKDGAAKPARPMRAAILAVTAGNAMEFYDFITFAFFAIQIGHCFFPSHDKYLSLMGSLATFGAGFISRPIGAYVLGGYADKIGRKPVMLITLVMMGGAIATLALTPSYATIGLAAPIIAVLARVVQGFALGGEIGCSTVYMLEAADADKRGFSVSLQSVSQYVAATLGALVGFGLSSVLTDAQITDFGWRIALLLGASAAPFALLLRRSLPETRDRPEPVYDPGVAASAGAARGPTARQAIVLGAVIGGAATIATYAFNYTATFGQNELHLSVREAMAGQLAGNGVAIVASLIGGRLTDRFGRRPLQLWPQIAFAILILPCFTWLLAARSVTALISINLLLGFVSNLSAGAWAAAVSESLPKATRSRAFALVYALPVTLLGGTTQLFITWLLKTTGTPISLAWYLTGVQVVGLIAIIALPESAPHKRGLIALEPAPAV